jgi:inward rectifier potassium channel
VVNTQGEKTVRRRAKREIRLTFGDGRARTPILWELGDPYYWLMEIRWPAFVGAVVFVFLLINLGFGVFYALVPGTIANAAPGSLTDGFFFSVDTLATVGYGNMYPASRFGHTVASAEILLGLFFMATVTGLIFARFARPKKGLVFSRHAVIGRHEGQRALMVRAVWTRPYPLLDATAQLAWLELVVQSDGQSIRRLRELELIRSHNPMLGLAWTLVHILPDDSDIVAAIEADQPLLLTANVSGTDMLLSSTSHSLQRYWREDVRLDHEFADMIFEEDSALRLDFSRLDLIQPIAGAR